MKCLLIVIFTVLAFVPRLSFARDRSDTTFLSVKDYGAKGDGKQDNSDAFLQCFGDATKNKGISVVNIPYGIYNITRSIKINIKDCHLLIIRGKSENNKLPVIESRNFITLLEVYSYYWAPKGKVSVSNLSLIGNNQPFTPLHPYFDKPAFCSGISLLNLKDADIHNNYISNVYGNGISIGYSSNIRQSLKNRFDRVTIANNYILNCWGLHPTRTGNKSFDDYGDGIYTNSIKSGYIHNNRIVNDLEQTKQFGRVGITLEYNDEDCRVTNNYVFGYDRDIHIERDIGGHLIKNDTLEGSDFGILVYDVPLSQNKPIEILSNYISNKGLPLHNNYRRVRNSEERCLLSFFAKGECRKGSEIMGNQFIIDPGYAYTYASIVRFAAEGLIVKDNNFISHLPAHTRKTVHFYQPVDTVAGNVFNNVDIFFTKPDGREVISDNKTEGSVKTNLKLQ